MNLRDLAWMLNFPKVIPRYYLKGMKGVGYFNCKGEYFTAVNDFYDEYNKFLILKKEDCEKQKIS